MHAVDATSREYLERAWAIRFAVFVDEQRVPADEEVDAIDTAPTTRHVIIVDGDRDLGTGRLLVDDDGQLHIGRVAVRREARGLGVGRRVMNCLATLAFDLYGGAESVTIDISAQEQAMPFYASLGYEVVDGRRYLDAGIWHQDMRLLVDETYVANIASA